MINNIIIIQFSQTTFGRSTLTTSQELDRATERADKTSAELRRTEAELRVTRVSILYIFFNFCIFIISKKITKLNNNTHNLYTFLNFITKKKKHIQTFT